MVNARLCPGAGDQAARARCSFAVDAFIAGGCDLQDPTHQTFELVGLCGHGRVAAGLRDGHANARNSARTDAGGKGLGFHRVDGADAHIARGGQKRLAGQNHLGRTLVFRVGLHTRGTHQKASSTGCGTAAHGRIARTQYG